MAKPQRRQRHTGQSSGHSSPAKRPGTRTANSVGKDPISKATTNSNRAASTVTSTTSSMARSAHAATGAVGSTAIRQRAQARPNRRRYQRKPAWWSGRMPVLLSVVGVLLIVGVFVVIAHSQNSSAGGAHTIPSASVLNAVEHPNSAIFDQVGAGTSTANLFKALPNKSDTSLPRQQGKPVLFYAGGEYCPFCAADRWSLIMALSRFGSFSGIETNASSTSDGYPGTPTFTFVKTTYTSPYLVFDAKEIAGATENTPLQSLTSGESSIFATYDVPPYDSLQGGIPFIDFGGLYMTSGGSYDVGVLHVNQSDSNSQALTYAQILSGLSKANSPIAQSIVGTANEYTAAICMMTNNTDKAVCSSSIISQIESQLPKK
jgi:hypothetical protein